MERGWLFFSLKYHFSILCDSATFMLKKNSIFEGNPPTGCTTFLNGLFIDFFEKYLPPTLFFNNFFSENCFPNFYFLEIRLHLKDGSNRKWYDCSHQTFTLFQNTESIEKVAGSYQFLREVITKSIT